MILSLTDIDECTTDSSVCSLGTCKNTQGGYECTCNRGFRFNSTTGGCTCK